ncbi:hypothetical protein [Pseudomonas sp. 5P_3.1_Bac2]|nr:hypothetical protein [Pseudomonas sp. 5P_3.1_Bac2]MCU1718071.1 hypothetical protein [Pseudomonas sp. 5P_3.1_Bac2]
MDTWPYPSLRLKEVFMPDLQRNAMDRAYEQLRAQGVDVRVP